jgi:Protein of unknown function (DUF3168)
MSWQIALRSRLLAAGPLIALVGKRIDWKLRPQGSALPAIVLTLVSDPRPRMMKGPIDYRSSRVWIDCVADTRAKCTQMSDAVLAVIEPNGLFSGVRFGPPTDVSVMDKGEKTETGFTHCDRIEARIWHN